MADLDWPRDGRHIFVGGDWLELTGADRIESVSPIDEEVCGYAAAARAEDVDRAVDLITPALAEWAALGVVARVPYLRRFADAIAAHADQLAALETLDGGLTAATAARDIETAVDSLGFFSSYAYELTGSTYSAPAGTAAYTVREPYGIVGCIVPFNHPIMFAVQYAAPVLLAGNAVIIKPAEQAPLSTLLLAEIARGVLPDGVFNVITGYGHEAGDAIVGHPRIPRIGFTGSVPTGRRVLETAARHIKHVSLELGGKNPLIVTADADADFAAQVAYSGMNFTHAGQSCQSTSRVLVHTDRYDEVVERLAERMRGIVVGDPRDEKTVTGPLTFRAHLDRVLGYIDSGIEEGARLVVGGHRPDHLPKGFYLQPALFADVTPQMRIAREEIFGPVVSVMRYVDVDEAVQIANATEYGLTARVVAGTLDEAAAIGRRIEAGTTLLNTAGPRRRGMPFGGHKASGLGKQSCLEEVLSYTQEKSVVAAV
ncbi:aldehyde dehydrogenase family protein [Streptomyces sp. NPDC046900]|uniref:aldehyde dehydrogenase family protein n=1 Tax=Streptomyces sp. NPDC046900 TaxID=3155473 RepID=UPI0033C46E2D